MPQLSRTHPVGRMMTAAAAVSVALLPLAALSVVGAHAAGAKATPKAICIPTPADDAYSTAEATPLTVAEPGVVTNDSLCGSDGLVISLTSPTHGTLTNFDDSGGGFTYTPDPGFTGADTFTYRLEDVENENMATVTITVTAPATTTTTAAPTTTTTAATTTTVAVQAVSAQPTFTG